MVSRMLSEERIPVKKRKARIDNVSPTPEEGDLIIDEAPIRSPSPEPRNIRNERVARSASPKSNSSRNERRSMSPKSPTSNGGAGWNRNRNAEKAHRARENTKYCMGMVRGHLQEMKESMQTSMDQLLQHLPMRTDMTVLNLIEKFRDSRRGEVVTDALIQSRSSAATILSLSTQTTDMFRWYVGLVSEVLKGVEETKGRLAELEKRVAEETSTSFYDGCGHPRQSTVRATPMTPSKPPKPPCCDCGAGDSAPLKKSQGVPRQGDSTPEHGYRWWTSHPPLNSDRRQWDYSRGTTGSKDVEMVDNGSQSPTGFTSRFMRYKPNDAKEDTKSWGGRPVLVGGGMHSYSEPMAKRLKTEEPIVDMKSMELTDLVAKFAEYQSRLKDVFDLAVTSMPVDSNLRI